MGGRVSQLTATMAGMLNIKPILTIQDGKLEMLEKDPHPQESLGTHHRPDQGNHWRKAIERMNIVHTDCMDEAKEFEAFLRENIACPDEINILPLTAGLSVHTGPGFVGVSFITEK